VIRRALLAFLALPGVVAIAVPLWLGRRALQSGDIHWSGSLLLAPGLALLVWCAREFLARGKGTLAPWDPPRHLVSSGLYRVSRNPMYLAVVLMLLGWTVMMRSVALLIYTGIVFASFHLRVVFGEEPTLARVYGRDWTQYAARVPRWLFPNRRAVAGAWAMVLILLPMSGLFYEAYADARDQRAFPPPGMRVDIGGRRLHLLCIGSGDPIVFFEASGFSNSLSSMRARERIAEHTTACSYDRSGMGWSDPAAEDVVSIGDLARDLAVLQDRARLHAPYVIVASSIGGLTAELFARQFPERVAGLVMLDAANSLALSERLLRQRWLTPSACAIGMAAHFGIVRLADPFRLSRDTSEGARRGAALLYNSRPWMQLCAMGRGLEETVREFAGASPLRPDLPLTVLSASTAAELIPPGIEAFADGEQIRQDLQATHQRLARASSRGTWRVVPNSTHLIASSQPDAIANAVLEIVEGVK
jgi:protein-S-isoprenylcysteine O-methyltransferase Ste14/pimeloyl-ACP methyl ester carboxylesterase